MRRLLQDLVSAQAQERPDATAIVFGTTRWSYGELDRISNRLACVLKEAGCRQGEPIAVLMPKSMMAVAALLGICKADGVCVPVDPASPCDRVRRMLKACEITRMLAGGPVDRLVRELIDDPSVGRLSLGWLESEAPGDITVDFSLADLSVYAGDAIDRRNRSFHPAHVVFTPSQTGVPKGVILTHANVIERAEWMAQHFGLTASDRVSGHPPLHVDMSLIDLFMTATAGAELHLVPPVASVLPNSLTKFIHASAVTHWSSMPSVLSYIAEFDLLTPGCFPALKRVVCAGALWPTSALIYWMQRLPDVTFSHLYGAPETAIVNTVYTVPECPAEPDATVPIGTACAGDDLLVLDSSMERVPHGSIGELYIAGPGVSRGYWGDIARTNAAFVRHPARPQERIYRTGDRARVDEYGRIFIEARDGQIKTGGDRAAAGAIEFTLGSFGTVRDTAAAAFERGLNGARRPIA